MRVNCFEGRIGVVAFCVFFPRFGSATLPSKDVDGPEKEDFGDLVPSLCEER